MWLTDPKTKQKSVTLTMMIVGFGAALLKLILSGLAIGGFVLAPFTGTDFAAVMASLGGIYGWRKYTDAP